jgi:hypothetical protein
MTLAAAGAIQHRHLPNSSIQWLLVKPWMCYLVMRPALYHRIRLVIKIASNVGVFLCIPNFVVIHNLRFRPYYGP